MSDEVNGKHILSIDEMLNAEQIEYRVIPAWKVKDKDGNEVQGYVRIASLTAEQMAEWRATGEGENNPAKKTMGLRLFVDSLVDKDGKRIGGQHHYAAFKKTNNAIQERVLKEILDLNGITEKKVTEAKNE